MKQNKATNKQTNKKTTNKELQILKAVGTFLTGEVNLQTIVGTEFLHVNITFHFPLIF